MLLLRWHGRTLARKALVPDAAMFPFRCDWLLHAGPEIYDQNCRLVFISSSFGESDKQGKPLLRH
jgi:hypothetical protein